MNDSGVSRVASGQDASPAIESVPRWARFGWLRAGFSCRQGGLSQTYGPDEQNLGWTADDEPTAVAENRHRFVATTAGSSSMQLITVHQMHGDVILDMEAEAAPLMTPDGKAILQGDGLMSARPGWMLGIVTADCVPVLVADTRHRAVAAFHAGWRGTVKGIVEQGIGRMRERYGSQPDDLVAAIGPAIGRCCFVVGEEVRSKFLDAYAYAPELMGEGALTEDGARPIHVDLAEANRRQLLDAGLRPAQITMIAECTACTLLSNGRRKYFSHRAEAGFTGRMLSVIGVDAA